VLIKKSFFFNAKVLNVGVVCEKNSFFLLGVNLLLFFGGCFVVEIELNGNVSGLDDGRFNLVL
jgi:hypothetical protein